MFGEEFSLISAFGAVAFFAATHVAVEMVLPGASHAGAEFVKETLGSALGIGGGFQPPMA